MLTSVDDLHSQEIAIKLHRCLHARNFECHGGNLFNAHAPPLLDLEDLGSVSYCVAYSCSGYKFPVFRLYSKIDQEHAEP
jgi:hypothetical protein